MSDPENATTQDNAAKPAGMSRGLRVVLIVSLSLNLLIAGVLVGGVFAGRAGGPLGGFDASLGAFTRAMNSEDRAALRDAMQSRQELRPPRLAERRQVTVALLRALRSDPLDVSGIEAIFEAQQQRAIGGMVAGQEVLLERLIAASPEARAAYADRLEKELRAGPRQRPSGG